MQITALFIFAGIIIYAIWWIRKPKVVITDPLPVHLKEILLAEVPFYRQLAEESKVKFEERARQFLTQVKITGVKTTVEDLDRVLIAASAIIPIFNFPGWQYRNLHEVLVYPDSFDHEFAQEGANRNILGMVGTGALNHMMILSRFELRQSFSNTTGKNNTAIHEFVHLVDKTDGDIDGVPGALLDKKYIVPWLKLMRNEMELIRDERSDIDPYGLTSEAEFFAVAAEYFFERPALLKEKRPELYALLEKIFSAPGSGQN